jgi:multiple sugar transport system substrate-binding protein
MFLRTSVLFLSMIAVATHAAAPRPSMQVRYLGLDICTEPHRYIFDGWQNATGGTVEIVTRDIPSLIAEVERDLAIENYFDIYQVHVPVFDYARKGMALDVTDSVLQERYGFKWLDIMFSARRWMSEVQGRVVSIPVDADPLVLYYRRDLIETPPTTWEELIATAQSFHGKDLNGDGVPDYGTCLITESQFSMYAFAIANTVFRYSNSKREHYLFDANDDDTKPMNNLIPTKGYEYVFEILKQLYNVSQHTPLVSGFDPTNAYATWKTGRCATFISFPSAGSWVAETPASPHYIGGTPCCTFMRGKQGTTRTPGSTKVYSRATGDLVQCTSAVCKNQEWGGVNRPTFMDGGVRLMINAKSPNAEAALSFAGYFSARVDTRIPGGLNSFRTNQFDASWYEELTPISWVKEDARQYTSALYDTMNSPTTSSQLNIPGSNAMRALFEEAMQEYIGYGGVVSTRSSTDDLGPAAEGHRRVVQQRRVHHGCGGGPVPCGRRSAFTHLPECREARRQVPHVGGCTDRRRRGHPAWRSRLLRSQIPAHAPRAEVEERSRGDRPRRAAWDVGARSGRA